MKRQKSNPDEEKNNYIAELIKSKWDAVLEAEEEEVGI